MKQQITSPSDASAIPTGPHTAYGATDNATLELLATWRLEDATQNTADLRAAEQELADFKKAINENRADSGEPLLYP